MLLIVRFVNIKIVSTSKRLLKIPKKYRASVENHLHTISKQIQAKREEVGLTQEELAEKLNISPMTMQFIEQGRRFPSVQMLFYICEYLKINISID